MFRACVSVRTSDLGAVAVAIASAPREGARYPSRWCAVVRLCWDPFPNKVGGWHSHFISTFATQEHGAWSSLLEGSIPQLLARCARIARERPRAIKSSGCARGNWLLAHKPPMAINDSTKISKPFVLRNLCGKPIGVPGAAERDGYGFVIS